MFPGTYFRQTNCQPFRIESLIRQSLWVLFPFYLQKVMIKMLITLVEFFCL